MKLFDGSTPIWLVQKFHCDRFTGDILSLYVKVIGANTGGGEQYIASSWQIYNELQKTDPEILTALAAPDWPFEDYDP